MPGNVGCSVVRVQPFHEVLCEVASACVAKVFHVLLRSIVEDWTRLQRTLHTIFILGLVLTGIGVVCTLFGFVLMIF